MKSYYVKSQNLPDLQDALGRLIEYAKFLEEESGRTNLSFVDTIIRENDIVIEVVDA